jgi:hypothetical protein
VARYSGTRYRVRSIGLPFLAQLEMQMRDVAADAGFGDDLAALDLVTLLDFEFAVVGIGCDNATA